MLLVALVVNTMYSGMHSFVLTERHYRMMDRAMTPLLRFLMRGRASEEDGEGKWKAHSNEWVWLRFRLAPSPVELCVRRVQLVQHWVRAPQDHRQAIAAVWSETVLDVRHDKVRIENGEICASSTPCAKQFQGDVDEVAKRSEVFREWWVDHRRPLRLFTDGREMFLALDCVEMRAASFTHAVPPPGWEGEVGVAEPLPQAGDVDHSEYDCDYIGESGQRCESSSRHTWPCARTEEHHIGPGPPHIDWQLQVFARSA